MSDIRDEVDRLVHRELRLERLERDLRKALDVLMDCQAVFKYLAGNKPAESVEVATLLHVEKLLAEVKL